MAKRKKTRGKGPSVKLNGRKVSQTRGSAAAHGFRRYVLPLAIIGVLLAGIAFFAFSGYQTAIASNFFAIKAVDVRGAERTSADDIRRIVTSATEKPGV